MLFDTTSYEYKNVNALRDFNIVYMLLMSIVIHINRSFMSTYL